jgi:hypothetical protein
VSDDDPFRAATAIDQSKAKVTIANLDRLVRLEEFFKEEQKAEGIKIILCWTEGGSESGHRNQADCTGFLETREVDVIPAISTRARPVRSEIVSPPPVHSPSLSE